MELQVTKIPISTTTSATDKLMPARPVSVKAVTNERVELFIDGVKYMGSELVNGKQITLKKVENNLVFELDGEAFAQIDNFYDTQGATLDGLGWQFSSQESLTLGSEGVVALPTSAIDSQAIQSVVQGSSGFGGGSIGLGAIGLAAIGGGGGSGSNNNNNGGTSGGNGSGGESGGNGGVTTPSTPQTLALAKIEAFNNGNGTTPAALTVVDYEAAGITGVTADNLAAVNSKVLVQSTGGADTVGEIQGLVKSVQDATVKITNYAAQNGGSAPTEQDYADAGVTGVSGNLAVVNSALASAAVTGAQANNTVKLQAIVNAYQVILGAADGRDDNDTNPTLNDYNLIGVVGVDTATKISLLGDVVDIKSNADVNTVSKVQALADAVQAVIGGTNHGTPPTQAQLELLGLTGLTTNNLPAVLTAIGAATSVNAVDSLAKLQAMVSSTVTTQVIGTIQAGPVTASNDLEVNIYAADGSTPLALHVAVDRTGHFAASVGAYAGVVFAKLFNKGSAVDYLDEATGTAKDLSAALMAMGVAVSPGIMLNLNLNALTTVAVSKMGMNPLPSEVNRVNTAVAHTFGLSNLLETTVILVNGNSYAVSDGLSEGEKYGAVLASLSGLDKINGGSAQATIDQITNQLSVVGATATLTNAIKHDITAGAKEVAGLMGNQSVVSSGFGDSVAALIDYVVISNPPGSAVEGALAVISTAAQNNSATGTAPSLSVYTDAGVTGVTSGNLAAINSALDSAAVNGTAADTTGEVQAIVNAYNAMLASADGLDNVANSANPTQAQYGLIGVTGVDSAVKASLLGDAIDLKSAADVDTVAEVQALADAAAAVITGANGGTAPTLTQLQLLGITGVTSDNLAAVVAAIDATANDGTGVDTKGELQTIVTAAINNAVTALTTISTAAQNNSATGTAPSLSVYTDAGVTGVTSGNLAAINSALDSAAVNGTAADTTGEVQAIVNAYNAMLASADGTAANTSTALTGAQYTAIGVTGVTGVAAPGNALYLLDSAVDASAATAVDTVAELQAMADAAARVIAAAGGSPADITAVTLTDLNAIGITGVTADNLPAVVAAIGAATPDSAVDTQGELQTIVTTAINNAVTALTTISTAAQNNSATGTAPSLSVYTDAGVTGVTSGNLAAINSALDSAAVNGTAADTTGEVQAIVNAYNAMLASADGTAANTSTALTGAQYTAIGVTGISGTATLGTALGLLDSAVDASITTAVDTPAKLQAMADAASHVIAAVSGNALNLSDLSTLGVTGLAGLSVNNQQRILVAIDATANDGTGADTLAKLQALVNSSVDLIAPNAPVINSVATDNIVNLSEVGSAISGTNESGASVQLTLGGNTRSASVNGTTWSYTLVNADIAAMGQGPETLSVTQTDAAGNTSPAGTRDITVDTLAPTVTVNTISGGELIRPEYDLLATTPLTISGSTAGVEDGRSVNILLNRISYSALVSNNLWSKNIPTADA